MSSQRNANDVNVLDLTFRLHYSPLEEGNNFDYLTASGRQHGRADQRRTSLARRKSCQRGTSRKLTNSGAAKSPRRKVPTALPKGPEPALK